MRKVLEPIKNKIENGFDRGSQEFFQRVFTFSDKLTKVSDVIKSFPKGHERKQGEWTWIYREIHRIICIWKKSFSACINALKDVDNVELGTYLPSNPEAIIIGLLAESGAPMQRWFCLCAQRFFSDCLFD